ncbi:MAG TPA: SRPBCC family protein [Actinomycetota bacterium]|nr:SRPBCC family protein [Actinomycetota bacterium]
MWEGTVEVDLPVSPEAVWDVVADIERHRELAGSGEIRSLRVRGPIGVGTRWEADHEVPGAGTFQSTGELIVFQPPTELVWKSFPPLLVENEPESMVDVTWWFRLSPTTGGTHLEHGFRVIEPRVGADELVGFFESTNRRDSVLAGMRGTLSNLQLALGAAGDANE